MRYAVYIYASKDLGFVLFLFFENLIRDCCIVTFQNSIKKKDLENTVPFALSLVPNPSILKNSSSLANLTITLSN